MINELFLKIKSNKDLYEYLKYHSYWYEKLILDNNMIEDMIKEMKDELKMNPEDKLKDISNKLELFSSLLNVLS